MIEGIDVSSLNGTIDWARVKAAGIGRVYIRALLGRDDRDPRLVENANGCRAVGLDFGVYGLVYARHLAGQDGGEQGCQLARISAEVGATRPPALDIEDGPPGPPTGDEWLEAIGAYVYACEREAGAPPVLYTYPGFWEARHELIAGAGFVRCPLWIAHYTNAPAPIVPKPWKEWAGWQYASSAPGFEGRVDGVPGLVDRSRWRL